MSYIYLKKRFFTSSPSSFFEFEIKSNYVTKNRIYYVFIVTLFSETKWLSSNLFVFIIHEFIVFDWLLLFVYNNIFFDLFSTQWLYFPKWNDYLYIYLYLLFTNLSFLIDCYYLSATLSSLIYVPRSDFIFRNEMTIFKSIVFIIYKFIICLESSRLSTNIAWKLNSLFLC